MGYPYQNENYIVAPRKEDGGYKIINHATGQIEGVAEDLPSAILMAVQYNFLLVTEYHKKVEKDLMKSNGKAVAPANIANFPSH